MIEDKNLVKTKLFELKEHYVNNTELFDKLDGVLGGQFTVYESKLGNSFWMMFDSYCDIMADFLGIHPETLHWFIYDNEWGNNGLVVYNDGVETKVNNIDDLIDNYDSIKDVD